MNPFLSIKGRLIRAAIASSARYVAKKQLTNSTLQEVTSALKGQTVSREKLTMERIRTDFLIRKAFKDSGFEGNVYVDISLIDLKSTPALYRGGPTDLDNPNMAVCGFTDHEGKPSAMVRVDLPDAVAIDETETRDFSPYYKEMFGTAAHTDATEAKDYATHYKEIYAMAGHEAAHIMHKHDIILSILPAACVGFSPILGSIYFNKISSILRKLAEVDADLTSARKLGTAKTLAESIAEIKKIDESKQRPASPNHPSFETRISYLEYAGTLFNTEPDFFKSTAFQNMVKEKRDELKEKNQIKPLQLTA